MRHSPPRPPGLLVALLLLVPVAVLVTLMSRPDQTRARPIRLVPAARQGDLEVTFEHLSWDPRRLAHQPPSVGLAPLFEERFEGDLGPGWQVARTTADFPTLASGSDRTGTGASGGAVEVLEPPAIAPEGEGNRALVFAEPAGAASTVVAVTPDTPYEVAASVTVAWPGGPPDPSSLAAHLGVLELARLPDLETGSDADRSAAIGKALPVKKPLLIAPEERAGARTRILFKTSVYTHALLLVLIGGLPDSGARGRVSFDDLTVTALPLRRYLPHRSESAADDIPAPPEGQEFFPTIKMLGDLRDALLLPPPSSMTLRVKVPSPNPILEFGYGVPEERLASFGQHPTTFSLAVIDQTNTAHALFKSTVRPAAGVEELGWHDNRVDLSPWEGKTVRLRFRTETEAGGRDMGVFGSPVIRPRPGVGVGAPSVILVSIDTLRADHLGLYGYPRKTSPFIDSFFATEGQYLTSFRAASPYTLPSHASIMTGQYPGTHGVEQFDRRLISGVHPLLAEILADEGYVTAAFTAGAFLGYEYGFRHGFDTYTIIDPLLTSEDPQRKRFPRMGDKTFNDAVFARYDLDHVLDFVTRHKDGPFFLFLHTYLVHDYAPPPEYTKLFAKGAASDLGRHFRLHEIDTTPERREALDQTDIDHIVDTYDACIRAADDAIRRLVEHLRREGLLDDTLLVVTSDHGEEFREHGGLLHGRTLYQEQLGVPFLLRVPWRPERGRVEAAGHHVDVAPTILDLLDLSVPAAMQGHPLSPVLQGIDAAPSPPVSRLNALGLGEMQALRDGSLELIETLSTTKALAALRYRQHVGLELYDQASDPQQLENLAASRPEDRDRLHAKLLAWRQAMQAAHESLIGSSDTRFAPSDATRDRLGALGYVGDGAKSQGSGR